MSRFDLNPVQDVRRFQPVFRKVEILSGRDAIVPAFQIADVERFVLFPYESDFILADFFPVCINEVNRMVRNRLCKEADVIEDMERPLNVKVLFTWLRLIMNQLIFCKALIQVPAQELPVIRIKIVYRLLVLGIESYFF